MQTCEDNTRSGLWPQLLGREKNYPYGSNSVSSDTKFEVVFDRPFPVDPTLLEVLKSEGGEPIGMRRIAVAAWLNSSRQEIGFRYSQEEVVEMVRELMDRGDPSDMTA